MHLGIDLDNTIIRYDAVFHAVARAQGWISADVPATKHAVRAAMRSLPEGEIWWTRLQGLVYGPHLGEADPAPGVIAFLADAHARGLRLSIISHKARHPAQGPRVDLQAAALTWLDRHLFSRTDLGITRAQVFFEPTQDLKAQRVLGLGCTHLIDDLPEFLKHPLLVGAPLTRLWYAPDPGDASPPPGARVVQSWAELQAWLTESPTWMQPHASS